MIYAETPADFSPQFEVVTCLIEIKGEILLFKVQDNQPTSNIWDVPTGKLNSKEDSDQGLRRVIFEKTGTQLPENVVVKKQTGYVRYPEHDFVCHIYHITVQKKFPLKINSKEYQSAFWIMRWKVMQMILVRDLRFSIEFYYKVEKPTKFCEECKKKPVISGGRFCSNCTTEMHKKMKETGYITRS